MPHLLKLTQFVSKTFALWVLLFAFLAFVSPEAFREIRGYIPY